MQYEFSTERLLIREYRRSDLDAFIAVTAQPEVRATTYGIPENYTKLYGKRWFRFIRKNMWIGEAYEFGMFLKENGRYVGNVGLIHFNYEHHHAEITYYIDKNYRNLGLVTEAAKAMLRFGFGSCQLEKISGICMSCNEASRRVMEKIGMQYEGTLRRELFKDGVFYDIDRLSILREEYFTDCKVEKG